MADDDEAAAVGLQVVAQPDDRVGVEVVGRLVEQQRVGVREEDAGQLDTAALTAGERVQRLAEHAVGQAERGGDGGGLGLGGVPALGEELRLQALVPAHRLVAGRARRRWRCAVSFSRISRISVVEAAGGEDAVAGEHVEVAGARVLRQVADLAGAGDGAGGRLALAGEDLGQGGLARRRCGRRGRCGRPWRCGRWRTRGGCGRRHAARYRWRRSRRSLRSAGGCRCQGARVVGGTITAGRCSPPCCQPARPGPNPSLPHAPVRRPRGDTARTRTCG